MTHEFKELLKHHDWTFMMSDDHRAYVAGQKERDEIHRRIRLNPMLNEVYKQEQRRIFG